MGAFFHSGRRGIMVKVERDTFLILMINRRETSSSVPSISEVSRVPYSFAI